MPYGLVFLLVRKNASNASVSIVFSTSFARNHPLRATPIPYLMSSNPARLDMDWRLLHKARDKGIKIPLNPDAHTLAGLDDMRYGIGVARKGWLRATDVLNTMETETLRAFFQTRRNTKR